MKSIKLVRRIRTTIASLAILAFYVPSNPLQAREWKIIHPTQLHGYCTAIEEFGDYVYIGANLEPMNRATLSRTKDGVNWERVLVLEQGTPIHHWDLVKHKGALYALFNKSIEGYFIVYRTTDGLSWQSLDNEDLRDVFPTSSVVSFGDRLYFGIEGGAYRSVGEGTNLRWERAASFPENFKPTTWVVFKNKLFSAGARMAGPSALEIYSTADGIAWSRIHEFVIEPDDPSDYPLGFAIHGQDLFAGHNNLLKYDELSADFKIHDPVAGYGAPASLHGQFHLVLQYPLGTVISFTPGRGWESSETLRSTVDGVNGVVHLQGKVFVAAGDLFVIQHGFVRLTPKPVLTPPLRFDDKNVPFLAAEFDVNMEEILTRVKVKLEGSARPETDVSRLYLNRTSKNPQGNEVSERLAELVLDPTKTYWTTPPSFRAVIRDRDQITVSGDVSTRPRHGATFRCIVEDMEWLNNSSDRYVRGSLSSAERSIQGNPAPEVDPLAGVEVAPVPARDEVKFLYDLENPADVEIVIFDRNGDAVCEIKDPGKPAGLRAVTVWNASTAATGVYYATMKLKFHGGGETRHRKKVYIEK